MNAEDPHHHHRQRLLHFARIRRVKWLLRFMPRRARFHTYPLVGRFADFARKRSYLWSFRYTDLRASLYTGSILSLMPAMGVQLPIAFALCLFARTNFMIAGGLQFITNPVTAAPIYFATYKLGELVLFKTGWGPAESVPAVPEPDPTLDFASATTRPIATATDSPAHIAPPVAPVSGNWLGELSARFRVTNLTHLFNCLVVGGLLAGLALGTALDLLWRLLILPAARHRAARKAITAVVTPHDNTPPSPPDV